MISPFRFTERCQGCARPMRHGQEPYYSDHYRAWFCEPVCMEEWQSRISFKIKRDKESDQKERDQIAKDTFDRED